MGDLELQHRIRLALSWRAEARRLEQQARERFDAGALEAGRYQHLLAKFASHAAQAQRALEGIRRQESENAARLGAHLRDCLGRKAAIAQQVKDGAIAHDTAASEIARLDEEIKALRDVVGEFNRLLSLEDAAALGGPIHAGLDEFPLRLADASHTAQATDARRGGPSRRLAIVSAIIIAVGLSAIFFILRQNQTIEMQATWDAATPTDLVVECVNRGATDFILYVPAPEDGAPMQRGSHALRLLARDGGGETLPLNSWGFWTIEGRATQYSNPQRLLAGKRARFVLDLSRVAGHGTGLREYTVECVALDGSVQRRGSVTVE